MIESLLRNKRVIGASLVASLGLAGCGSGAFDRQLNTQVQRDGFTIASGEGDSQYLSDNYDYTIGKLILGKCTFLNVGIKDEYSKGKLVDVASYTLAVVEMGVGKNGEDPLPTVEVTFDNAKELGELLPNLNCANQTR